MAQRPSFDINRLSTADKILLGASLLFLIDSFLPWQRACAGLSGLGRICGSASAWSGNASWAGVLAGICAILLLVAAVLHLMSAAVPENVSMPTVIGALAAATVLFAVLKFLLIIGKAAFVFAYIGLILALAIAYGAYLMFQGRGTLPPATGSGGMTA